MCVDVIFNFSGSENRCKSLFNFSSLFNLELFGNFVNRRLNDSLVMSLISGNVNILYIFLLGVFGWKNTSLSINDLVILLNELRH